MNESADPSDRTGGLRQIQRDTEVESRVPRASLRDVAQLAGVAVSSASRVLTDHPDVSPAMRRRVLTAADQLGYEPDFLAQSFRSGATFSVGFVVRDISSPLLAAIALGAERTLRAGGYSMLVLNSEADPILDAEHIRLLERRRVDGLLISLSDEANHETLSAMSELSVPTVLIDREVAGAHGSSAVLADHEMGMQAVVANLADLGHRVIGLVAGPLEVRPGREGARSFRAACAKHEIEARVESGPFAAEHGFAATNRLLAPSRARGTGALLPTAIVAGSNQIFPGVLKALRKRGLRIPAEISLVTFDDLPLLELLDPPIDVVRRGAADFGQTAAELLLRRLADGNPESILIPTVFERRGSSAPPPRP
jgi:LacI family transcriptional regulator